MLRRMKASPGVDLNLPPKTEVLLAVPLTPLQRTWYQQLLTGVGDNLLGDILHAAPEQLNAGLNTAPGPVTPGSSPHGPG